MHSSCCSMSMSSDHRKGNALGLLQDLYAHSERINASTSMTEAVRIKSEVVLVNQSTTAWQGHLHITLAWCQPSERDSKGAKPCKQSWRAAKDGLDSTNLTPNEHSQSTQSAAARKAGEQGQESRMPHLQQRGMGTTMRQHSLNEHDVKWVEPVQIPPGRTCFSMRDRILQRPHLWWPLNMGEQVCSHHLYFLHRVYKDLLVFNLQRCLAATRHSPRVCAQRENLSAGCRICTA